jgi:hypothetical protein
MRRTLKTLPAHRAQAGIPVRSGALRGARSTIGHHLRRQTAADSLTMMPTGGRDGFIRRLARRVRSIRPPLTADQQLRLLHLALNVKLKRESKPPGAIRLTLQEPAPVGADSVAAGSNSDRPIASSSRASRAR